MPKKLYNVGKGLKTIYFQPEREESHESGAGLTLFLHCQAKIERWGGNQETQRGLEKKFQRGILIIKLKLDERLSYEDT